MKTALIVMTILGCDDSATQCHYIDTVERSWQTVALCDAQAESEINRRQASNYPVIVAVCENPRAPETAGLEEPAPQAQAKPAETSARQEGLAARALGFVRNALPDTAKLKAAVSKPVHSIEDGYAWVLKRFAD